MIVEKFGTTKIPMLKDYKNLYLFLIGKKLLKTLKTTLDQTYFKQNIQMYNKRNQV